MLESISTSRQSMVVPGGLEETAAGDPLLSFAGSITGSHALVIAPNGLDLMCSLMRRGCVAATTVRLSERCYHETYDLVLAPRVVSAEIGRLVQQARRALLPRGRFLAFVPTASAEMDQDAAGLLMRFLRSDEFVAVRTKISNNGLLVRADLPMNGLSSAMPILLRRQA